MGDLAGTDSLVLGGSRGIGKAVADCLARDGSRVTIVARTVASAREAAARLPGTGHTGLGIDLREPAQIAAALEPLGAFDIVILNSPGAAPNRVEDTTLKVCRPHSPSWCCRSNASSPARCPK